MFRRARFCKYMHKHVKCEEGRCHLPNLYIVDEGEPYTPQFKDLECEEQRYYLPNL